MNLAPELVQEIVAHAREAAPKECCGLLAMRDDGTVARAYRARNAADSKVRFEVDSRDHLHALYDAEDAGLELGGIYHSHPRTEPAPSLTDRQKAVAWPGALWVIVGLEPEVAVRAFRIDGDDVAEL